jgi:hypothetical protein
MNLPINVVQYQNLIYEKDSFDFCFLTIIFSAQAKDVWIEAESFQNKGGWVVDPQFMDMMGSPYIMAHGMGVPVKDASTSIQITDPGEYQIYVRTYNWTAPFTDQQGPGKFQLSINDQKLSVTGYQGKNWEWQKAGTVKLKDNIHIKLHDLSGFNGRCDAIYLTTSNVAPPNETNQLKKFRAKFASQQFQKKSYDFVVVGGGIAGMCAAVSAARLGCKVALIHDRPILGGNNSSEVRVHLGGRIALEPYPELGNLIKEMGPSRKGNAKPADYYEDAKKEQWIRAEKNITLYLNTRATGIQKDGKKITGIEAVDIESGQNYMFNAPYFADCTGDGSIGYWAGADFSTGRESKATYNEPTAPEVSDRMTMGSSVQWNSIDTTIPTSFPLFQYGLTFNESKVQKVSMGEWTWETGMNWNQITEFEKIRDYGLLVVFSNWSYLKNNYSLKESYQNKQLAWVAYIAGKRESRRLLGDYILTENDLRNHNVMPDGSASTTWSIDLHYPDPKNSEQFSGEEFLSIAKHIPIHSYPVPYRCLYSRNIDNLFMAGRNISVSHVALGTVRVMRTTGMLGEVVGMAASICVKKGASPRQIYTDYLDDLKALMISGTGVKGLPNNQKYNPGKTLDNKQ